MLQVGGGGWYFGHLEGQIVLLVFDVFWSDLLALEKGCCRARHLLDHLCQACQHCFLSLRSLILNFHLWDPTLDQTLSDLILLQVDQIILLFRQCVYLFIEARSQCVLGALP